MFKNNDNKKGMRMVIGAVAAAVISFVLYYIMLPPINVHSRGFWGFLFLVLAIFAVCLGAVNLSSFNPGGKNKSFFAPRGSGNKFLSAGLFSKIFLGAALLPLAVILVGSLISSTIFNAHAYAEVITVDERNFEEDMPEADQISNIALMDTDSARILGNRKLGALANVVSQYVASDSYTQINFQGAPMKITHLEYDGFFKWLNNRDEGVPGYIMVDAIANTAEYYELPTGMTYTESAYFSEDLERKLRFDYPTKIFDNISFEADEEGNVWYVISCSTARVGLFGAMDVNEAILFNPVDGTSTLYALEDVPKWVDIVFDGYHACEKYDWQGLYSGGFINSIIGQKGCKQTTDDFGYLMLDDDVWYFTGVTSVTADASNIGFLLSCARTGEYKFYSVIGAEEYSAMGAAEGEVQEKGYVASFPALINVAGEPSYIMVLKDANGLVKLYAMVNVKQYNIVATGETQAEVKAAYLKLLAQSGVDISGSASSGNEVTITVGEIRYLNMAGITYVYITDSEGAVYRMEFNAKNEAIVLVKGGDSLKLTYTEDEASGIRIVNTWEKG